jgi:hypothetical protein
MPLPEGYLPREGDVLIVYARVKYNVDHGDEYVHVNNANGVIGLDNVIGIHSRKWEEDDAVRFIKMPEATGVVRSIRANMVWIELDKPTEFTSGIETFVTADSTEIEAVPIMPDFSEVSELEPPHASESVESMREKLGPEKKD